MRTWRLVQAVVRTYQPSTLHAAPGVIIGDEGVLWDEYH